MPERRQDDGIRVILVDDHPVMRWGFAQIVTALADDICLLGQFAGANDALKWLADNQADIAVVDIGLEGRSGLELLERISDSYPDIKVLLYTRYQARDFALQGLKLGAAGYLSKNATPDQIVEAIRQISTTGTYLTPDVAALMQLSLRTGGRGLSPHASLSIRQSEVLQGLLDGESVTQIAKRLNLSVKTISTHRTQLLSKLGLRSTAELVRYAMNHGIFS